jgi:hypothetical protein
LFNTNIKLVSQFKVGNVGYSINLVNLQGGIYKPAGW